MKKLQFIFIAIVLVCVTHLSFAQNFWTHLNGPFGGETIDLKKSINGNLFTIRNEDIFTSSTSGESWNKINQSYFASNLCMDISSTGKIYAGKSSGGLWWTANNGQSWNFNPISIAPHSGQWASVIIVKVNSLGHVYINNHVSLNGGQNFSSFNIGGALILSRDYAFNSSNHVYAATQNGIFYSVNNGSSWTNINGNLAANSATSLMFDNNDLVAGLNGNGVFKTSDNGVTWIELNNGLTDLNIIKVYKDEQNNYYAAATSGKVFKSSNLGISWTLIYNGNPGNRINSIYSNGSSIFLATKFGILNSVNNGMTWTEKNNNLMLEGINSLAFSDDNNKIFSASTIGVHYSPDNGVNWETRSNNLPAAIVNSVFKCSNGDILAGLRNLGIYRSSNDGISWQPSNNGISTYAIFKNIRNSPNGYVFAVGEPSFFDDTLKLYRSSDNGLSWTSILLPQTNSSFNNITIDASGNLFISLSSFTSAMLKSTDNGNSWSETQLPQFLFIENFTSSGNDLYLTSSGTIFKSTDMGVSWTQINSGGWQTSFFSAFAVNRRGDIFASTGNDLYVTTNNGLSWQTHNSGLVQNSGINKFIFDNSDYIYSLTHFKGIFKSVRSTITSVISNGRDIPNNYSLSQNYPNPFNPVTNLEFGISDLGFVSLIVFDVIGNEVAVLINEMKNAGNYKYQFSTINYQLSSGIYFYSLLVNGSVIDTKKMILLK